MFSGYANRSYELERIDTGDYTAEEYDQFLEDIRLVNRFAGDNWALNSSLIQEVSSQGLKQFSVLDVGAGSGEILRACARFARRTQRSSRLVGLELSGRSAAAILEESADFKEISAVRADGLDLPFENNSFDYVVCSLFTHHFSEAEIVKILRGMSRVGRRKLFVIDLHRHAVSGLLYRAFCALFVKGILVKTDGALSIKRGFKPAELQRIAEESGMNSFRVSRSFPFRLVLEADISQI